MNGHADRIRDLVEVAAVETVVRLDGQVGRLQELVLTGDVRRSLQAVLDAARGERGAGFLLVGHFGSGKSHFLAALGELLEEPRRALSLEAWDAGLRSLAAAARPSLVVSVPLVEYRAGADLEDVTWRRAWQAAGRPAPELTNDRSVSWGRLLGAGQDRGRPGLLLLVDELSEFLRAKRGPGLVEDLRFLQFLGEWATEQPVVVLGALQESLDEVANVSERELARIRDRYPVRLGLSMRHVEDLVRGRLVLLRPGAEAEVARIHGRLREAFPTWEVTRERFAACYPVHPDALTLLDGLRFLLSQQRGVVDFICRQLRGDEAAGIPAWVDQEAERLLGPDRVYDHFEARLRERVETSRLAETVVPHYERAAASIFESVPDQELALRTVKLLTLLAASPLERRRTAAELAEMLLCRVSVLDPQANVSYLQRAILEPLVSHGAFVVARPGADPATPTYEVLPDADAGLAASRLLEQARAQLEPRDRRVIEALVERGRTPSLSLDLLRESGRSRRQLIWQQTLRQLLVTTARLSELGPEAVAELAGAVGRTGAEAALVIAEPEPADQDLLARARALAGEERRLAIWAPDPLTREELDFCVDLLCRQIVLRQALDEGGAGRGDLVEFLRRSEDSESARAREILRRAYFQGRIVAAALARDPDLPSLSGQPFDAVLRAVAAPLLEGLHPRHQFVQPRADLVGERNVRRVVTVALSVPRLTVAAADREGVRGHIEGYLVPLGLVRRRGDAYQVAPDPARSPAVAELLRLVGDGPRPAAELVRALAEGPVGLTEPETLLLLNAAVQSGIVEATRGRRRLDGPLLSLAEVDRLGPGELVAPELRGLVLDLGGVFGPGPHEPWDARVQQASWEHARAWIEARREDLAQVRDGLRRLAESSLSGGLERGELPDDIERLERLFAAVNTGAAPRPGLEQFLSAVEVPDELLAGAGRVAAAARFCRVELDSFLATARYLTDPALAVPDAPAYQGLRSDLVEALELASRVLPHAARDEAETVLEACEQFRRAFSARYAAEHQAFHATSQPKSDAVTASAAYHALARLAEVAPAAVADDRARVDRMLMSATVPPCHRNLEAELALRPRCGCGFQLGEEPPAVDVDALIAVAERGVAQHLAQLEQPDSRSHLERAASDLRSLGQGEVAADLERFLELAGRPDPAQLLALGHLLDGRVRGVLHQVLRGGQVVVHRDLSALREDLAGRRYPKRRLLELVQAWVEGPDGLAEQAVVEVVDSAEAATDGGEGRSPAAGPTVEALQARFPGLAAALPAERPAEAFWLAAWWAGRDRPPAWLPPRLLERAGELRQAAAALTELTGPRAELAEVDARTKTGTLLADQLESALGLVDRNAAEVCSALLGERLLRQPVRLASAELLRRLAADLALAERLPLDRVSELAAAHPLLTEAELAPVAAALAAAQNLAALERALPTATPAQLVEDLYPAGLAPVPSLLSEAAVGWALFGAARAPLDLLETAATRVLATAEQMFSEAARGDFAGCLKTWEVGDAVVAPLLRAHGRVAVLLVDAMRADVWLRLRGPLVGALPGRRLEQRWAVTAAPTRTAEAVTSLALGRPVAAGEVEDGADLPAPFAHLGYETRVLVGADRDTHAQDLVDLWRDGPPLGIAVATGVDERLHHSPVDVAALLAESVTALERRVLPALRTLPAEVPLVVLADHGFRENRSWGRGAIDRYAHGGPSLPESVVPVAVLAPV